MSPRSWIPARLRTGSHRKLGAAAREQALRRVIGALMDGDLAGAEVHLSELVQSDSADAEVYRWLGRVFRRRGEVGRAIRIHQNLLLRRDLGPDARHEALRELAEDFRKGGYLKRATHTYEELVEQRSRDAAGHRALAELYEATGEFDRAIAAENRAARLGGIAKPERQVRESELWLALAHKQHDEGDQDGARRALRGALRRNRANTDALLMQGELEAERGKNKAALKAWQRVVEIDASRGAEVYPKLAATYAALDKPRAFETWLQARLDRDSRDAPARIALAKALAARGESDEAVRELRRVLDVEPRDAAARQTLCHVLLSSQRESEAAKELGELVAMWESGSLGSDGSAGAAVAADGGSETGS